MKTPEEIAEHAAWQLWTASQKSDSQRILMSRESFKAHVTGAIIGDRLEREVENG